MLEIEFDEPQREQCQCCGNTTTRLTRFVYQYGDAFAVYFALFTEGHEDQVVHLLIGLGEWGEDAPPEKRTAFAVKIWQDDNWNVTVTDRIQSPWRRTEFLGNILDREEALNHPWIQDVFHISDYVVMQDKLVIDYFS